MCSSTRRCEPAADGGCTVEKLYLGDLAIKPCTGCRACRKGDVKTICTPEG